MSLFLQPLLLRAMATAEGKLLEGFRGEELNAEWLSEVLRRAEPAQQPLPSTHVASLEMVSDSEKRWPQSHSAQLKLFLTGVGPALLYMKKVFAGSAPPKNLDRLRKDLESNRNEARFYTEFAAKLRARGVPLLRAPLVDEQFHCLDNADLAKEEAALRRCGYILLLECVDAGQYVQTSPLAAEQLRASLQALAHFHAASWEDLELLSRASERLHPTGTYWTLQNRHSSELQRMQPNWEQYLGAFRPHAPDVLGELRMVNLAKRLEAVAEWVSSQLQPAPHQAFATLVHGDPKAMNMFLPSSGFDLPVLIDFQWTGVGFSMADVAMILPHSADLSVLGGEEEIVRLYYDSLVHALEKQGRSAGSFSFDQAWHLYRLAFVDYARMVFGNFFKNASPEAFEARSHLENVGMVYRNVDASLSYVQMVDGHVAYVERLMGLDGPPCQESA